MSRHTPGPWVVHPFRATVDAAGDGEMVPVCGMLWPTGKRTEAETEANARLIAAAPDMAKALKDALRDHGSCDWNGCWCQMARSALGKAGIEL